MSSVRPSVLLSVTLLDQAMHTRWKSWKLIARAVSPALSLIVAQSISIYSPGNMGKFGGDKRPDGKKYGVMEHDSGNMSERRKDRGKVTIEVLYRALQKK